MDIGALPYDDLKSFFLILTRVGLVLFLFPFFNSRVVPTMTKAGLALILTLILYPVTPVVTRGFPDNGWEMLQLIMGEALIGIILGLLLQLFFEGVRMMGQLVGFQTGFAMSNILDPMSGNQVSIMANMAYWVAMVIFLLLNGHHILLSAMSDSFEIIRLGSVRIDHRVFQNMMDTSSNMFMIALKIGSPAIAALLFTKVAFGLITKLMPQMNIMIVAFPVQIMIGLFFFGISLNVLLRYMGTYLDELDSSLLETMAQLRA
jgi:flagellar biosynthesis protein FliR